MATRAQLRTYARTQTLLDTADVTNAEIDVYLDRAVATVGARFPWPFLQASDTFDSIVGTREYSKPTGCKFIDAITEADVRRRLREIEPLTSWQRWGDDPPSGKATAFYLWEDKIVLVQTPTSVITYNVFYRTSPTFAAGDSDTPEWDSQFHWLLGDYAAAKLWEREEDLRSAQASMQNFEDGIGEMAQFYINQADDSPMVWGEESDRIVGWAWNTPWIDGV